MRAAIRPFVLSMACLTAFTAQALELAKYPKVLVGAQGVEVVLAPTADGKQALVRVTGINDPIDQVVFLSTKETQGAAREVYTTPINGRSYGLLHKQTDAYGGEEGFTVYLPGKRDGVSLAFSNEKSKALSLAALQASYERQQKQGVQEKLARFDRNKRLANAQADLVKSDQEATEACGTPVKTTVDWASIDDEKLQSLSIASFCGAVASEMESLCRSTPAFKTTAAGLGDIQCQFAPPMKIRIENKQVVFSTEKNAPNQGDFVRQFLRNQ